MSPTRALAATLCALAGMLAVAAALAQGAPRVVLLAPAPGDPLAFRLRRELELLGVEVDLVVDAAGASRDLASVAQGHHAAAAVVVEARPPSIVLFTDPALRPGGPATPQIRVDAADPRLGVLRAVETLRERLLAEAPAPARSSELLAAPIAPPLPAAIERSPASIRRSPSAFAGAAVLLSPGGVGATPHVWLGVRWAPVPRLDLELFGLVPTTGANVSAPEGNITLRAGAVGAGAGARFGDPDRGFFATVGGGLGALFTRFDGQATAPLKSASGLRPSMLPYLHAAGGYWLVPQVALRIDALAGVALPEPVVTFAGRHVAFFGEPAVALAAAIEVRP